MAAGRRQLILTLDKPWDTVPVAMREWPSLTFVLSNNGSAALTEVNVSDPLVGTVGYPADALAAGASMTCTATYTLTQADVDAGHVANTATGTGTPPGGGDPLEPTDSTDTPIAGPAIALDKEAAAPSGNTPGDTIDYTFLVTNIGNVTLDPVSVSDPGRGCWVPGRPSWLRGCQLCVRRRTR